jgi:serine/threonine protein kinase
MSSRSTEVSVAEVAEATEDEIDSHEKNKKHNYNIRTALDEVRSYMEKLKPKGEGEESTGGVSSWAKAQMEESPVLLYDLKFHDLVFGQELGSGAFSTVKYARHIVKTRTRSSWPEYAVKVVSTQKIEEMGYEQSINREIAILRTLSHPGISRLVSSFRFRDGAYLVLEYASGGDLHTLLRRNGSLDHNSTRFVIGSVAAALSSIHELGFVYADCKPENILITETGHIKVTDFGGCRPVTEEAKLLVKESSKNLLRQLRDGDWRPSSSSRVDDVITDEQHEEDLRIEGTTAYLPPEVVIGGYPTTAADVWALGCVLFQCISGRPPILEDTDHLTIQKIVTFSLASEEQNFFGEWDASAFRYDAKALIRRMLHRDASCRPNIVQIAEAEFFEGMDIFALHKKLAHPLDVGSIAPDSDAKWSRRQFR